VLRREVSVFPGQPADLREINRSLARIEGTGYFSDQFDPEHHHDPLYRFVPVAGEDGVVDLEYQVEEGRVVEFNVTGGVDSNDGAFGLISLTMRNFDVTDTPTSWWHVFGEIYDKEAFHGAGQRVDIELSPGTQVSRFRVHFLDPDIFNLHLKPISLDLDLQRRLRTYSTHDEDRFEKRIRFGRRFGFDTTVSLGFLHTDLTVEDVDDSGVPASLDEQDALGDTVLAGITFDVSNRSLDNYLNPRQGYKLGFNNIFYDGAFGSDFEFIQSQVHWDYFHPTGEKADGTKPVMHLEFDGGVAQPYGATDDVPYTERFFLGGTRTLRGFEFRGVGPRGVDVLGQPVGFAAGGETYLSGTFEWQYPLLSIIQPGTYKPIESLRSVLFLDWGVLDPEPFQADLSTTRTSIGFGVGLAYPFPILLNFGFPIHREDGDKQQTFSFSAGFGN
jgi:outer membrane protein insertion porin family